MQEKIGKVTLDYSRYPGQDFYSDGAIEDELLETVKHHEESEFVGIIKERNSWPFLYHLSYLRENIVDWVPMDKDAKVLEVGSGCGAITGALARKAGTVTCVDLSKKRSLINAYRHKDYDNVTIHVGNFKDIEQDLDTDYDYICLIGVFEYAQSYIGGNTPFEDFLKILMKHLSPKGRMLIAIENKLGLKYFAGCREDHVGTFFDGIENYKYDAGVRTFSRTGLERIFKNCGVEQYHFYYPYPDYKFMSAVYSDEYLPKKGELTTNHRNFDKDRMLLFDENLAFNGIVEDELFSVFSNSYMVVLGDLLDVKFTKYSNDRAEKYRIKTEIRSGKQVRKYPAHEKAVSHIKALPEHYGKLTERYQGSGLEMNRCTLEETEQGLCAAVEYVEGTPLSDLMNLCLQRDDMDGFYKLFEEYVQKSCYGEEIPVTNQDMIFANVFVNGDKWTVLDYEWTFDKKEDSRLLAFRAMYYFAKESEYCSKIDMDKIRLDLGISKEEAEGFWEREQEFQNLVAEEHCSLEEMRSRLGNNMWEPQKTLESYPDSSNVNRVQIYQDYGQGYSEEDSYYVNGAYITEKDIVLDIKVESDATMLRVDPSMCSCMVKIKKMTFNGKEVPFHKRKQFIINGTILKPVKGEEGISMVFSTDDPNINISLEKMPKEKENLLHAEMEMIRIPAHIAAAMENGAKKYIRYR